MDAGGLRADEEGPADLAVRAPRRRTRATPPPPGASGEACLARLEAGRGAASKGGGAERRAAPRTAATTGPPRGHRRRAEPRPGRACSRASLVGLAVPIEERRRPHARRRGDHRAGRLLPRPSGRARCSRVHPGLPCSTLDRRGREDRAAARHGRGLGGQAVDVVEELGPASRRHAAQGGAEVAGGEGGEAHLRRDTALAPEAAQVARRRRRAGRASVGVAVAAEHVDGHRARLDRDPARPRPPGACAGEDLWGETVASAGPGTPSAAASMLAAAQDGIPTSVRVVGQPRARGPQSPIS